MTSTQPRPNVSGICDGIVQGGGEGRGSKSYGWQRHLILMAAVAKYLRKGDNAKELANEKENVEKKELEKCIRRESVI